MSVATAFDESKNVFLSFTPMVESMLTLSPDQASISFLALQQKINDFYKVNIPKNTLRSLIEILEKQGKVKFVDRKYIYPVQDKLRPIGIDRNKALSEIEDFFLKFKEYLNDNRIEVSHAEIRENVCNWVYSHSSDLAYFIDAGKNLDVIEDDKNKEWKHVAHLLNFLLKIRKENTSEYRAFVKLFDGAVQTSLLNFNPKDITDIVTPTFNISNVILDTNFVLRLVHLQDPLDCDIAYETWKTLQDNGTHFYVLDQTINEACSSIRFFLNESAPYAVHTKNFLTKVKSRTSGFLSAMKNGKTRTDLFVLSDKETLKSSIENDFCVTIIDDYSEQPSESDVNSLIISKNSDSYGKPQAEHDLVLISYCRKRRKNKIRSFSDAEWWVLTNDKKLTYWNQCNNSQKQECITEVQLSNLLWLQSKKDSGAGLTETIVITAAKFASNLGDISIFANQVSRYAQKNADSISKLDTMSLVLANQALSVEDIRLASDDDEKFETLISEKAEEIKANQEKQQEDFYAIKSENDKKTLEIVELSKKLELEKLHAKQENVRRSLDDISKEMTEDQSKLEKVDDVLSFCKKADSPVGRALIIIISASIIVLFLFSCLFLRQPILNYFFKDITNITLFVEILGSGVISIFLSAIYYVVVGLIFGSLFRPSELFAKIKGKCISRKKQKYILEKKYPVELLQDDLKLLQTELEYSIKTNELTKRKLKSEIEEIELQISEL